MEPHEIINHWREYFKSRLADTEPLPDDDFDLGNFIILEKTPENNRFCDLLPHGHSSEELVIDDTGSSYRWVISHAAAGLLDQIDPEFTRDMERADSSWRTQHTHEMENESKLSSSFRSDLEKKMRDME